MKTTSQHLPSDSSAHLLQKEGKPLMEKRRRARINESLSRLKLLVLGEVRRKNAKIAKLDKADILEMTVEYVSKVTDSGHSQDTYRTGYNCCADEVRSYLASRSDVDVDMRTRVLDHLANFIQNVQWLRAAQTQQLPKNMMLRSGSAHMPRTTVSGKTCTSHTGRVMSPGLHLGTGSPIMNTTASCAKENINTTYRGHRTPSYPQSSSGTATKSPALTGSPIFPPSPVTSQPSVFVFPDISHYRTDNDLQGAANMWRPW